jgi:hypothetical protein
MLYKLSLFYILWWIKAITSFRVDFSPLSPVSLQPGVLPLCGNCREAIIVGEGRSLACRLFGRTEVVWGSVEYKACSVVRRNESMCGLEGRYYYRKKPFTVVE